MKLLTFLGTTEYKETTYVLGDFSFSTRFCQVALAHFFRPETTLVVVTKDAHAKHFESLADQLQGVSEPVAVPIPDGHRVSDLWAMFDALTDCFNPGDSLIADITNGFRSLPFLSFLALAFLRTAKQVRVEGVYYGAYDAKDASNRSPIFDLTPFVTLLDWTIGTDRFVRSGDARDLAHLLKEGIPLKLQPGPDDATRQLHKGLKAAASTMEHVTTALRVVRPLESMKAAARLVDTLREQRTNIESQSRPFALLVDRIVNAFQPFALSEPESADSVEANLAVQLRLVRWYIEKDQILQAVALAREWMVSALVSRLQAGSMVDLKGARRPVEDALNNAVEKLRPDPRQPLSTPFDEALASIPGHESIVKLWDRLGQLRNDLAHVGMKTGATAACDVPKRAKALCSELDQVARILCLEGLEES